MSTARDVRRLVKLCATGDVPGALVDKLRHASDELAIANHGERLVIEVAVERQCHVRFGITATGTVIHPLGGDDPADVRVDGTAQDVARFLLGDDSFADAVERGFVTVRPGLVEFRLERLRAIVADNLRALLDGHPVLVPASALAWWRLRRLWVAPAELTAALANVGPAVVATVAMLGGPAPATASPPVAATQHPVTVTAAAYATSGPDAAATPVDVAENLAPTATRPTRRGATATSSRAPASISTGVTGTRPGVDGSERTLNLPVWQRFECNSEFRAAVCDAVEQLPRAGR